MTVLITGGAGFIGSNLVRHVLRERPSWRVINLDALKYSGNMASLAGLESESRHRFVHGDIGDEGLVRRLVGESDAVLHLAAESHVDRSIADGRPFVVTNVLGTFTLLEAMRQTGAGKRFVAVGTDEVYGSLALRDAGGKGELFTEESRVKPRSPYAASKAGADHLCLAARATYGLDVVVTRSCNNFGAYQFPEKLIPLFVTNVLEGKGVPLYGDGLHVRDWLHVEDQCSALVAALEHGRAGEVYNISAENERSNIEVTREILRILGVDESRIERTADRAGHDRRYALDASKARRELGWKPVRTDWPAALRETVEWYQGNRGWWEPLKKREER